MASNCVEKSDRAVARPKKAWQAPSAHREKITDATRSIGGGSGSDAIFCNS
jgi:hypothetical protein